MRIMAYFTSSKEKLFAQSLAQQLAKSLPPALLVQRSKMLSVNKITIQLEKTLNAAAEYQVKNNIGFYKRAILANAFKWELKSSGYPDDFIDLATEGLVVKLSKVKAHSNEHSNANTKK